MNERIYELYRQAHLVREYPADDPMRGGNPPTVYWGGDESAKRFAELIVGHATECVRDVLRDENSDLSYVAATQVQNRIKEFFGVEE
jgi:hypothetical protein